MKTIIVTEKYLLVALTFVVALFMSTNVLAYTGTENVNHEALAAKFENTAKEMQTKANQQKSIFSNKPSASFFGRGGERMKKRIIARINEYTEAAEENFARADYHLKMAEKYAKNKSTASGKI